MIQRYSSRRSPLKDFLATQLQDARRYDRIAGFFSSSLLEVAGNALERMTPEDGEACVRGGETGVSQSRHIGKEVHPASQPLDNALIPECVVGSRMDTRLDRRPGPKGAALRTERVLELPYAFNLRPFVVSFHG